MKTLTLSLALLMSLSSHAQTQLPASMPAAWQCSADCFTLGGNTGMDLYYYGNTNGYVYLSKAEAFNSLQSYCSGNTLLLKRKFKGVYNQSTIENVFERNISYYYRGYSETNRSYQVINTQSKAQFDVLEADENNSCRPIPLQQIPIYSVGGDPALG